MRTVAAFSLLTFALLVSHSAPAAQPRQPNIILILADDLGRGDLGSYGQTKIRTPHLDRMAAEGMRFTQAYAASPVCAPSRCALLTGKHMGHAVIRNNRERGKEVEGQQPMPRDTKTVAHALAAKGYRTGIIGKWGLGMPEDHSGPNDFGFAYSYGYLCQRQAHTFYPGHLWRNHRKEPLPENPPSDPLPPNPIPAAGKTYAHDLMAADALRFVRENQEQPFFLYLGFTIPHFSLQVPEDSLAEYAGKFPEMPYRGTHYARHETPRAAYAAMITRMDRDIGRLFALLKELNLDDRTLVLFASDNGATFLVHEQLADFFRSNGNLRGYKGSLFEGGIRTPLLARWPGKIKAGAVSDHPCALWDVLPTLCEITGSTPPANIDGISFAPTLLASGGQAKHDFLYWEYPADGGSQAVRFGRWKALRRQTNAKPDGPLQLFDLEADEAEQNDVAGENADLVAQLGTMMARARVDLPR